MAYLENRCNARQMLCLPDNLPIGVRCTFAMKRFENQPESVYNPNMSLKEKHSSDSKMMAAVAYLVLLAVAILGIQMLEPGLPRVLGITLLVIFGVLFTVQPKEEAPSWRWHLHMALLTAVTGATLFLRPQWGVFPMLFFILSPTAMLVFPQRVGFMWIGIFTVVTGIVFFATASPVEAFLTLLPFSAGYWFFGAFARAMASADEARKESQTLLAELQEAHRQLQEYAASVEELAIAEERNRLAREMHDTIGHRLTVSAVQLEGAQRLIPTDPERASGMIETVREQVRGALGELRATVATLREPLEANLTLAASLKRLSESFEQATDLELHLDIPEGFCPLPNAYRLALYRAAQEALTNVQRHAQARNIWFSLAEVDDQIELRIGDDGVGFPAETNEVAFGLRGMRERITHLRGEIYLDEREGGGAQLRIVLPKPQEDSDE
jgi:signal transduction histidine kinase